MFLISFRDTPQSIQKINFNMCGIYGFVGKQYDESKTDLLSMKNSIIHRGPDHSGFFSHKFSGYEINLGHNRLSIIDVSSNGHQPMESHSQRYVIIYNGEVYNFNDIRAEIEQKDSNIIWRGTSDTEVILHGIEIFGLDACLKKMVGMFGFALWDNHEHTLTLARDRIGEKPLYFGLQSDQLIFASELKAFEAHSKFIKQLDIKNAVAFLLKGYVPNNCAIYENVTKVEPGTYVKFSLDSPLSLHNYNKVVYWSLNEVISNSKKNHYQGNYEEAKDQLEQLLIRSIKEQTISDVPVGAFLSGGVDSSLICAILKKHVFTSELLTFTIAMPSPGINEAQHAEKVANFIKSNHHAKQLGISEILNRIEEILNSWDEPFADSSQIPTFFVSEFARKSVTVTLSGDGADEFVYGYPDYILFSKYNKFLFLVKFRVDVIFNSLLKIQFLRKIKILRKIKNFLYFLKLGSEKNLGYALLNWNNKFRGFDLPVKNSIQNLVNGQLVYNGDDFDNIGFYDVKDYLPNDILVKVDRAAMAFSLESRAPFLDHRVLEFIVSLPQSYLYDVDTGKTKKILKDILYKYIPKSIVDRPKQGFSIPLTYWLRNDLKNWALNVINDIPDHSEFWEKKLIITLFQDHLSMKMDHTERIWNILVLESFLKRKKLLHHSEIKK